MRLVQRERQPLRLEGSAQRRLERQPLERTSEVEVTCSDRINQPQLEACLALQQVYWKPKYFSKTIMLILNYILGGFGLGSTNTGTGLGVGLGNTVTAVQPDAAAAAQQAQLQQHLLMLSNDPYGDMAIFKNLKQVKFCFILF